MNFKKRGKKMSQLKDNKTCSLLEQYLVHGQKKPVQFLAVNIIQQILHGSDAWGNLISRLPVDICIRIGEMLEKPALRLKIFPIRFAEPLNHIFIDAYSAQFLFLGLFP